MKTYSLDQTQRPSSRKGSVLRALLFIRKTTMHKIDRAIEVSSWTSSQEISWVIMSLWAPLERRNHPMRHDSLLRTLNVACPSLNFDTVPFWFALLGQTGRYIHIHHSSLSSILISFINKCFVTGHMVHVLYTIG